MRPLLLPLFFNTIPNSLLLIAVHMSLIDSIRLVGFLLKTPMRFPCAFSTAMQHGCVRKRGLGHAGKVRLSAFVTMATVGICKLPLILSFVGQDRRPLPDIFSLISSPLSRYLHPSWLRFTPPPISLVYLTRSLLWLA